MLGTHKAKFLKAILRLTFPFWISSRTPKNEGNYQATPDLKRRTYKSRVHAGSQGCPCMGAATSKGPRAGPLTPTLLLIMARQVSHLPPELGNSKSALPRPTLHRNTASSVHQEKHWRRGLHRGRQREGERDRSWQGRPGLREV